MYTKEMLESIKKVEATREERLKQVLAGNHPRRMTADEKDQVLLENHPDHIKSQFAELKIGPNKGENVPIELAETLQANPRINPEDVDLTKIAALLQNRTEVFSEIPEQVDFIDAMPDYELSLYDNKKMKTNADTALDALEKVLPVLEAIDEASWNFETIHDKLFELIASMEVKNGYILWPVRVAISGKQFTPGGAFEIAEIIGKADTIARMNRSLEMLKSR